MVDFTKPWKQPRPVDDETALVPYGWAPGGYIQECRSCSCSHIAAKRASACQDCAELARDIKEATVEGRAAFNAGLPIEDNPHDFTSPKVGAWINGWFNGQEDAESTEAMSGERLLSYLRKGGGLDGEPSIHQLTQLFEAASNEAETGDQYAADPEKWPTVRGVAAVVMAMKAIRWTGGLEG